MVEEIIPGYYLDHQKKTPDRVNPPKDKKGTFEQIENEYIYKKRKKRSDESGTFYIENIKNKCQKGIGEREQRGPES